MNASHQSKQANISFERKLLFLLVSFIALGLSLYFVELQTGKVLYSVLLSIPLFAFLLRLHRHSDRRFLIPSPTNLMEKIVFWPVALFFLFAARYLDWTFIALSIALVSLSIWLAIRTPIDTDKEVRPK